MNSTSPALDSSLSTDILEEVPSVRTIIVLDTSVLLSDPESIYAFDNCDIVLPLTVIGELDKMKDRPDDVGWAARETARLLESLRLSPDSLNSDLRDPVPLGNNSTIRIEINGLKLDALQRYRLSPDEADNRILAAALGLQTEGSRVKLVSADINLRLKGAALGLEAAEYLLTKGQSVHDEKHPGWRELAVSKELVEWMYSEKWMPLDGMMIEDEAPVSELKINEYGVLKADGSQTALVRRTFVEGVPGLKLLDRTQRREAWGIKPKSKEQSFALDLLLNPEIPIVGLSGRAGTGKTLLALSAALQQTFEPKSKVYERVMILRPIVPVGNQSLGFLPGTLEEKLGPWMEAITDAMVALSPDAGYATAKGILEGWVEEGRLTLESVTFLRGRSLQNTIIIVDEAQNLEPLTLKTILTRLGSGSKVVLVGDVSQIDNPWASERSNAIGVLADKFDNQELFGHLVLTKGERSKVADLAANLL